MMQPTLKVGEISFLARSVSTSSGRIGRFRKRDMRSNNRTAAQAGYTYITMLMALVVVALMAQTTWFPQRTESLRQREDELIFRGLAYRNAIQSYWNAGGKDARFPPTLDSLLYDPRIEGRRHIRRLYAPVVGEEWRLIWSNGGIAGVAPVSVEKPFRTAGFPLGISVNGEGRSYSDWEFVFTPELDE